MNMSKNITVHTVVFMGMILTLLLMISSCSFSERHGTLKDITPENEKETEEEETEEESGEESEEREEEETPPPVWNLVLMVYMASDNDLESYALSNLREMERAEAEGVKILVLLDRAEGYDETDGNWTDTRLFEVVHDETSDARIKSRRLSAPQLGLSASTNTELDMSKPSVLRGFIEFSKQAYEAEKYALIIWGHGNGWQAVTVDDRSSSYMSVKELAQAVTNQNLSVIGFDTCFGGVFENVYEIKDCAEYTAACPGITPNTGWNYRELLEALSEEDCDSKAIAEKMAHSAQVSVTVFVNAKLGTLMEDFEEFSRALALSINDTDSQNRVLNELLNIRSYSYTSNPCDIYIDIPSMTAFYAQSTDENLAQAAGNLRGKLEHSLIAQENQSAGLGVHLIPKSASGAVAAMHSRDYLKDNSRQNQCSFIKQSRWWVPSTNGNSGSLLDKLFYTVF